MLTGLHLIEYVVILAAGIAAFAGVMWIVGALFGFGDSDGRYSGS